MFQANRKMLRTLLVALLLLAMCVRVGQTEESAPEAIAKITCGTLEGSGMVELFIERALYRIRINCPTRT